MIGTRVHGVRGGKKKMEGIELKTICSKEKVKGTDCSQSLGGLAVLRSMKRKRFASGRGKTERAEMREVFVVCLGTGAPPAL